MNITSYNVTDVGYHFIGLRVLAGLPPTARREEQTGTIARSVLKYVSDKALRLMLPEQRGTFETAGEKVCQELVHFEFATSVRGAYELTEEGRTVLRILENREHTKLRRIMATVHLRTYDNLRQVVQKHLEIESVWRPIVVADRIGSSDYIRRLLEPTFNHEAAEEAVVVSSELETRSPKKLEEALQERVLRRTMPGLRMGVPLFRSLCDRLISLRLLNVMRANRKGCEFAKSYTPCVAESPPHNWYVPLNVSLKSGESFTIYFCEPDMDDPRTHVKFLGAINEAFPLLSQTAGYYDLPEVRDRVCECLRIPEASFDEGLNRLLDLNPSPFTVGLQYEGITGRRKPLVRDRGATQIYNLIRRA